MLRELYLLTKPGIIRGNLIVAVAAFFFGSAQAVDWVALFSLMAGLSLVVASACVTNNIIDRDIDRRMQRTKKRALVTGAVSVKAAGALAVAAGVIGTIILLLGTTVIAALIAVFGWFAYVVVYGYAKRATTYGTVIGSISGATPPVIGYAAATGTVDSAALLLFFILVFWQMPHFYAIALFRAKEYQAADIPVLPLVRGVRRTRIEIICYVIAFLVACLLLTVFGYSGLLFAGVMAVVSGIWLAKVVAPVAVHQTEKWARSGFGFSLLVLLLFSLMLTLEPWLP